MTNLITLVEYQQLLPIPVILVTWSQIAYNTEHFGQPDSLLLSLSQH